ncbi:serine palmitoyltransferase component [Chytridiales sp. JEL 0842]|nr:serine palmitoyltransferase component [Chytridiales sp. JEL 0842]
MRAGSAYLGMPNADSIPIASLSLSLFSIACVASTSWIRVLCLVGAAKEKAKFDRDQHQPIDTSRMATTNAFAALGLNSDFVSDTAKDIATQIIIAVNTTFTIASRLYSAIPGSSVAYKYIKASHQNDPLRTALEGLLVVFMIWYFFMKKYKPENKNDVVLTEKEIEDLCNEWEPEPLVPQLNDFQKSELEKLPVIQGAAGLKVKLTDGKEKLNLASYNFMGVLNQDSIKEKAVDALRKYGVGSCGPPGFYGTLDCHMELEAQIAKFLGQEAAIIYSQGFSTIASVIPAFAKRGDILVVDEGVSLGITKGLQLSRAVVKYFKHNDMDDLKRVLEKIRIETTQKKMPLTRRWIIVEGVYPNYGDICPLPTIMELKEKYKYRLMLEDSMGLGSLGKYGRGTPEHFGIPPSEVDIITASMANSLSSAGGFCASNKDIVEYQRLSGVAYTFSASLPAILAISAIEALNILEKSSDIVPRLNENIAIIRNTLLKGMPTGFVLGGDLSSPVMHLRLRDRRSSREEEEVILQDIVDQCMKDGVIVSRSKYAIGQEVNLPAPSIRLCASAGFTKKEAEKAATLVRDAVKKVAKDWCASQAPLFVAQKTSTKLPSPTATRDPIAMSRIVSFVAGASAGIVAGVYLAQTYSSQIPNVEAAVKSIVSKAQEAIAAVQSKINESKKPVEPPKDGTN